MRVSLLMAVVALAWGCAGTTAATPQKAQPAPAATEQKAAPAGQKPPAQTAAATQRTDDDNANADALVLVDFKQRIDGYLKIHKDAAKGIPPLKETNNPADIKVAEEALAAKIRTLRASASIGDIFTPDIRKRFRRLMYPETKGEDGRDAKALLKDDAPSAAQIPFKVNATYPPAASLPTVPPNFLLNLPTLPEELEYRIVDKHLLLRDTKANIIVDFIPNAIT